MKITKIYTSSQIQKMFNFSRTRLNVLLKEILIENKDFQKANKNNFYYYESAVKKLQTRLNRKAA